MTRPLSVSDVLDTLSQHRLVEAARLDAFIARHELVDVGTTLQRLVTDGLLTHYQAGEIESGRSAALWLGGYRVLDRLGKGAMGAVFLAEHSVLGRRVAVKALSESLRADPNARKRFVREARAAATLDHPNIVRVFDVNMNNDPPYLVMEYVDGISLQAAVSHSGTFTVGETASVGVQVADGLVQAAAVGLVHRDIKPANLLVDRRGAAKILDLGIVRFTYDDTFSRLHGGEMILGTLDYLAPEQAEDSSKVDARADLYGLGSTLYFLLAGHPPYLASDPRQKLQAKRSVDPTPIQRLRPDVPAEFSDIIARLMARDPAERYPTPAAAVAALYPWSSPGTDFPARLFRPSSESTDHGKRVTDHEPPRDGVPPDTVVIVKGSRRVPEFTKDAAAAVPLPPPVEAEADISADSPEELLDQDAADFLNFHEVPPTNVSVDFSAPVTDTMGGGCAAQVTHENSRPPEMAQPLDIAGLVTEDEAAARVESRKHGLLAEPSASVSRRKDVRLLLFAVAAVGIVAALLAIFLR